MVVRNFAYFFLICSCFLFGNLGKVQAQDASLGTILYTSSAYAPIEISIKVTNLESSKKPITSSSKIKVEFTCKVNGNDLPNTVETSWGSTLNLGPEWYIECDARLSQIDGYGKTMEWDWLMASGYANSSSDKQFSFSKTAILKLVSTKPVKVGVFVLTENTLHQVSAVDPYASISDVILINGIKPSSSSQISKMPSPLPTKTESSNTNKVKNGAVCTSAGKVTTAAGITFVCAKVGSKLIWVSLSAPGAKVSPTPTSRASQNVSCSLNSSLLKSYIGTDKSLDGNLTALVFENLSNCNLAISANASFICDDGGILKRKNLIQSVGNFALKPKQKMFISGLSTDRYFPQVSQQCFQLTGFKTYSIDTHYGGQLGASVISSTP